MRAFLLLSLSLLSGCRTPLLPEKTDGGDGGSGLCLLDGGAASASPSVRCGGRSCAAPEVCCSGDFGQDGTCGLPENCPKSNRFACEDSSDCAPGSECCYSPDEGARCLLPRQCGCHAAWLLLCGRNADCPGGQSCCPRSSSQIPPGFTYCVNNACQP